MRNEWQAIPTAAPDDPLAGGLSQALSAAAGTWGLRLFGLFFAWHLVIDLLVRFVTGGDADGPAWFAQSLAGMVLALPQLAAILWIGRGSGLGRAHADAVGRWIAWVPVSIVVGLRIGVGVLLGVVPGILWAVQARFLLQAMALRPKEASFDYSRQLVKGAWWPMFGLSAGWLVTTLVGAGIGELAGNGIFGEMVRAAIDAAVMAAWTLTDTVVFLWRERIVRTAK